MSYFFKIQRGSYVLVFYDSEGVSCLSFLRFRGGRMSEVFEIQRGSYVLVF